MSAITTMQTMQRTLLKASLQSLRLPLTLVQRVTNNDSSPDWPPAVAFESFEASAKRALGALLRDDELATEGRLQQAKAAELSRSGRLQAEADEAREAADAELHERRQSAEQARARVEESARQRDRELKSRESAAKRRATEQARRRQDAATKSADQRDKVVSATERGARRTRVSRESQALAARRRAVAAEKRVNDLDAAKEAKKRQRKA